jgi:polyphenol oxidase
MFIHDGKFFKIYFGDARDKIFKEDLVNLPVNANICDLQQFAGIKKNMNFDNLVFLNQVHGVEGLVLDYLGAVKGVESFKVDGDFLVANVKGVAIGVLTADCLPIVFVDEVGGVVGIAHAGWRGSVGGIAVKTLECMRDKFGVNLGDVKVFFGPCIKLCCYKVADDFEQNLGDYSFVGRVLERKPDGLYFNLVKFNVLLLQEFGVKPENIYLEYNCCTVCDKTCDKNFYSYRRGDKDGRQATVMCLE